MERKMGEKVAFIGLGAMGGPMAQNIVKKGTNLSVYDIEKPKMNPLIDLGATPGNSIKDTIQNAEIIITMLPSTDNVKSVMCDADGILSFAKPGTIILDMSTIAPTGTDEVYNLCKQKNIEFIDAPVGRLVSHAISGDSLFMVGCDNEEAFKKIGWL
jgi:4-hydroxybutyrate dehydrogenase/sulfolactaldehyde 3-reductase